MSVQRLVDGSGVVRYKARVKFRGRQVAAKTFDRSRDAKDWEDEQRRKLWRGDWIDPKRGAVDLSTIAGVWLQSRASLKRRTREGDESDWRLHVQPRFGKLPIGSITKADVTNWIGGLIAAGCRPSSAARYHATLRSILGYAVDDGRISINVAASVKPPSGGQAARDGVHLSVAELHSLSAACNGRYAELIVFLGLSGLRWGELAGLQVRDLVSVPGRGLRLQRAVLSSGGTGELFEDLLKNKRARTVPLVPDVLPIVDRWAKGKESGAWLFDAPRGGPLSEANWKRSVKWSSAIKDIGVPNLRVHDLRHTAASVWLGAGADPKVLQRILGHASAAMTMDLYGHLIDRNLWDAAKKVGDHTGTMAKDPDQTTGPEDDDSGAVQA